jgi:NACHT domain
LNQDGALLTELKVADLECGPHVAECFEGTRLDLLERIKEWTTDLSAPNILWLKGHPGVGKSAIATSMVEYLSTMKRLGSRFFFQRQKANVMTSNALWRTVAYDLARRYPTIRKSIVTKLKEDDLSPTAANVDKLFLHLIHEPLVGSNLEELPLVVVIDALDECGGLEGQYSADRKALMRTFTSWSRLPAKFKLIVTSRGESDIERLFLTTRHFPIEIFAGQTVEAQSSEDIQLFLTYQLREVALEYSKSLPPTWPGPPVIRELAQRAGGLFIWAETVTKFIRSGNPEARLGFVLEEAGTTYLDTLYEQILDTSFPNPTASEIRTLCSVLGTVILAKAPLSLLAIAHLLSMKMAAMEHICNCLQSLIRSGDTLGFYHESFVDFLINPNRRTSKFFIMRRQESQVLTQACLRTMKEDLRFNICGLKSSHTLNVNIPDLLSREKQHIPQHLSYSCTWWASHLAETGFDEGMFQVLQNFMQKQFLFWLEVLSIIKRVNLASRALSLLVKWIPVRLSPIMLLCLTGKLKHLTSLMVKTTHLSWQKTCSDLSLYLPAAYHRAPFKFTYLHYHSRLEAQLCGCSTCKTIHEHSKFGLVD